MVSQHQGKLSPIVFPGDTKRTSSLENKFISERYNVQFVNVISQKYFLPENICVEIVKDS